MGFEGCVGGYQTDEEGAPGQWEHISKGIWWGNCKVCSGSGCCWDSNLEGGRS
jgi:hypothetical protein